MIGGGTPHLASNSFLAIEKKEVGLGGQAYEPSVAVINEKIEIIVED